jgi:hypothetical protein
VSEALPARKSSVATTIAVEVSAPVTGRVWIAVGGSEPPGGIEPLDPPTDVVGPPGTDVVAPGHGTA